jgi:hypothetical protein
MPRTLIKVPATAKRGEIIEIKTLISHPMGERFPGWAQRRPDTPRHHHPIHLHL